MNATSPFDYSLYQADFVFTNCSVAISIWLWLQDVVDSDMIAPTEDYEYPITIYGYLLESLDGYLQQNALQAPPPMNDNLWAWIARDGYVELEAARYAYQVCPQTLCQAVGWKGNPDMIGIGMMVIYLMQQLMVSLYLYPIVRIRLGLKPDKTDRKNFISRTLVAIELSTTAFLSASAVFSIALLLASTIAMAQQASSSVLVTWVLNAVVPLNSVFPVVVLHLATPGHIRRSKGRLVLWAAIDILIIVLVIRGLFVILRVTSSVQLLDGDPVGQKACADINFFPWVIICWTTAFLLIIGISTYVIGSVVSALRQERSRFARLPTWVSWSTLFISFFAMLFYNFWLVYVTFTIRGRTGPRNKDSEWTFGQVLALTTWAPFMVEFAYTWLEEPEEALNGRLTATYEVVAVSAEDNVFALARPGSQRARGQPERLVS